MRTRLLLALALTLTGCGAYTPPLPPSPPADTLPPPRAGITGGTLQQQRSKTTARLQAVSAVSEKVVWASGTNGSFAVTVNGGASWRSGVVAGADSLEFRDVHGVDDKTAYLLSAGNGTRSRIYKTSDAGQNWQLQFINRDTTAFYDCFAFWDPLLGAGLQRQRARHLPGAGHGGRRARLAQRERSGRAAGFAAAGGDRR